MEKISTRTGNPIFKFNATQSRLMFVVSRICTIGERPIGDIAQALKRNGLSEKVLVETLCEIISEKNKNKGQKTVNDESEYK